jgi:predicted homoserine dehydrogenase-like protein
MHYPVRAEETQVRAALIGAGHYGVALLCQARAIPGLDMRVVCERTMQQALAAFAHAGIDESEVVCADSAADALRAYERGRWIAVEDASLIMGLPLDVVVECTGDAEAGARHAVAALDAGKHAAMITKEADCAVGPLLKRRADAAGLVYTAVDGDQHGLLMGLVRWARGLGLEVVCGGKALDAEFVYDPEAGTVSDGKRGFLPDDAARATLAPIESPDCAQKAQARRQALSELEFTATFDLAELTIAANATGLVPERPELNAFALRTTEIPRVLCPEEAGGALKHRGAIEAVTQLRGPHEAGLGGGVFVVVACENAYSQNILVTKGLHGDASGEYALICRPYHLCGVETPVSVINAGLGRATGADVYNPRFDLSAVAVSDLAEGAVIAHDGDERVRGRITPAAPAKVGNLIPLYLALGHPLRTAVPAGTVLTVDMFEPPDDSLLWRLREEQDAAFLARG